MQVHNVISSTLSFWKRAGRKNGVNDYSFDGTLVFWGRWSGMNEKLLKFRFFQGMVSNGNGPVSLGEVLPSCNGK